METAETVFLRHATVEDADVRKTLGAVIFSENPLTPDYGAYSLREFSGYWNQLLLQSGYMRKSGMDSMLQANQEEGFGLIADAKSLGGASGILRSLLEQQQSLHPWSKQSADYRMSFDDFRAWWESSDAWFFKRSNLELAQRLAADFEAVDANHDRKLETDETGNYLARLYYIPTSVRDILKKAMGVADAPSAAAAAAGDVKDKSLVSGPAQPVSRPNSASYIYGNYAMQSADSKTKPQSPEAVPAKLNAPATSAATAVVARGLAVETVIGTLIKSSAQQGVLNDVRFDADWNARFTSAAAMPEGAGKAKLLTRLSTDFVHLASVFGRIIIQEIFMRDRQTLAKQKIGGIAGGTKFIVHGVLFKLATDSDVFKGKAATPFYMYGAWSENDEFALKAASLELKSAAQYMKHLSNRTVKGARICVPMYCTVDHLGYRLLALPVLGINTHGSEFVYGSSDGARTLHSDDSAFSAAMEAAAAELHLAPLRVKNSQITLWSAADMEGHKATDGNYCLLDFARAFPAEHPAVCSHLASQPQVCRLFKTKEPLRPLCADALTPFMKLASDEDAAKYDQNAHDATKLVLLQIDEFAATLASLADDDKQREQSQERLRTIATNIAAELHRRGINCRHMGLLRSKVVERAASKGAGDLLLQSMLQRTLKNILRGHLRTQHKSRRGDASDFSAREDTIQFLNRLSGSAADSTALWDEMPAEIRARFGSVAIAQAEQLSGSKLAAFLRANVARFVDVVTYVCETVGIRLTAACKKELASLRSCEPAFTFTIVDIDELSTKIKYCSVVDFARGKFLFNEATHGEVSSPRSAMTTAGNAGSLRLFQLAATGFENAFKGDTLSISSLREAAICQAVSAETAAHYEQADDGILRVLEQAGQMVDSSAVVREEFVFPLLGKLLALWHGRCNSPAVSYRFTCNGGATSKPRFRAARLTYEAWVVGAEKAKATDVKADAKVAVPAANDAKEGDSKQQAAPVGPFDEQWAALTATSKETVKRAVEAIRKIAPGSIFAEESATLVTYFRSPAATIKAQYQQQEEQILECIAKHGKEVGGVLHEAAVIHWENVLGAALEPSDGSLEISDAVVDACVACVPFLNEVNAKVGKSKQPVLLHALVRGTVPLVRALVDAGASVNVRGDFGAPNSLRLTRNANLTPLVAATRLRDPAAVKAILDGRPENLESTSGLDFEEQTALMSAAILGDVASCKMLIAAGARLNTQNSFGRSALHWASERGQVSVAKLLIEAKANVHLRDNQGAFLAATEPVRNAAASELPGKGIEMVKVFVEAKCDPIHTLPTAIHENNLPVFAYIASLGLPVVAGARHALLHAAASKSEGCARFIKPILDLPGEPVPPEKFAEVYHRAALTSNLEFFKNLEHTGTLKPDTPDPDNNNATMLMTTPSAEVVQYLLEQKASVNLVDKDNKNALQYAIRQRSAAKVRLLVDAGIAVNAVDKNGNTPLLAGASDNSVSGVEAVTVLLECGKPDIEAAAKSGRTALSLAGLSSPALVRPLIRHNAKLTTRESESCLTLLISGTSGNAKTRLEAIQFVGTQLLEAGRSKDLQAGMMHAVSAGKADAIRVLAECKGNVNVVDSGGKTLLMCALACSAPEACIQTLIDCKADATAQGTIGKTPRALAEQMALFSLIPLLLTAGEAKFDPNSKDKSGKTLLMTAAEKGSLATVSALIGAGARVDDVDDKGWTALQYGLESDNSVPVCKKLLDAGAKSWILANDGTSLLMRAAMKANFAVVAAWSRMSRVNLQDSTGKTALHYAVLNGSLLVTRHLLCELRARVDVPDKDNKTPLDYAKQGGNRQLVELLQNAFEADRFE